MTPDSLSSIEKEKVVHLITASMVRKILACFNGEKIDYRRLRWGTCSRAGLNKRDANKMLLLLIKYGMIATTKPQSNSARMAWLTPKGMDLYHQLSDAG